ncbi:MULTISPECIES: LysR family transcriptional regulator [unclassified Aureimonas]|uniref:LysR family transcriptional regulator n=1 Tax=unclassified Aureimonas TaxID=2615206 RepID=UPI0006FCC30D|nr:MULTISPECIES: LysR family transcriptional regulator [unclassified Aureimonas]KQT69783.1 LysR family transcriptional regulator [Aureimonas sp. Leaf427]KQT76065.1 LysR family transcriptional regulator [Aureimonas sp. Leaf460]
MDWEDLRHFGAFATGGSLSAAARALGVEHATVARRIAALEAAIGLKLVDRRGRRLLLTAEGEHIARIAERMAAETLALGRFADGARLDLTGEIAISAPPAYAARVLASRLAAFQTGHPRLRIRLLGDARFISLDRREADIAIRLTRPTEGDLTIAKLADMTFDLWGSAAYLAATRPPDWRFIGSDGAIGGSPQQRALERWALTETTAFRSDHAEIQLALVKAHAGLAMLPTFMTDGEPNLARARPEDAPLVREVWVAVHSDLRNSAPVRAVMDCLREI